MSKQHEELRRVIYQACEQKDTHKGTEMYMPFDNVVSAILQHYDIRPKPSPAEGANKSLQQTMDDYAKDLHYKDWDTLEREFSDPNNSKTIRGFWRQIAERYAAQQSQAKQSDWEKGVRDAMVCLEEMYGRSGFVHPYNIADCVLYKFNMIEGGWKPRPNPHYREAKQSDITGKFELRDDDARDRTWVVFRSEGNEDVVIYKSPMYSEATDMCDRLNGILSSWPGNGEVNNNGWIDVNDQLPEKDVTVRVFVRGKQREGTLINAETNQWDVKYVGLMHGAHITHWMPRPLDPVE